MKQADALVFFLKTINSLHIPYMITGAFAVSFYGIPRATHDVDVVVEISGEDVNKICRELSKKYEIDRAMVENAIQFKTHFSIIHVKSDLKADFWVLKNSQDEIKKFARRQKISLLGTTTFMISAEDMIITKLGWFQRFANTKHMEDVVGIIKVQHDNLDIRYIKKMLKQFALEKYWMQAVKLAGKD